MHKVVLAGRAKLREEMIRRFETNLRVGHLEDMLIATLLDPRYADDMNYTVCICYDCWVRGSSVHSAPMYSDTYLTQSLVVSGGRTLTFPEHPGNGRRWQKTGWLRTSKTTGSRCRRRSAVMAQTPLSSRSRRPARRQPQGSELSCWNQRSRWTTIVRSKPPHSSPRWIVTCRCRKRRLASVAVTWTSCSGGRRGLGSFLASPRWQGNSWHCLPPQRALSVSSLRQERCTTTSRSPHLRAPSSMHSWWL